MTTPTNWPNPERPGMPLFPKRDGWHWISYCGTPRPLFWSAKSNAWFSSSGIRSRRENTSAHWEYIEPALTPTQIAEMLAGERERCAVACEANSVIMASAYKSTEIAINEILRITAEEIRSLGAAP